MKKYMFTDAHGNEYIYEFADADKARHFAYVFGLCFEGSAIEYLCRKNKNKT